MSSRVEATERALRRLFEAGDHDGLATLAMREYGPEILGVLIARLRASQEASEVFSEFCEDFWRGLPAFRWQCPLRVWAYTLARHALHRHRKSAGRRERRQLSLTEAGVEIGRVVEEVRSTTLAHLRTETKSRMRELREQLPSDEQELLILRIDKGLSWKDLAMVMSEPDESQDEPELERRAARLRKRFQLAKDKLRLLAEREGLIE